MECHRIFSSKLGLNKHIKGHQEIAVKTKEKLIQCNICKKAFAKQQNLLAHKRVHKNDPPDSEMYYQFIADNFDMTCDQCDAKFTAFHDARQHYKDKHKEENGWIKCCGKKLRKLWMVRDHINTHLFNETSKYVWRAAQFYSSIVFHFQETFGQSIK